MAFSLIHFVSILSALSMGFMTSCSLGKKNKNDKSSEFTNTESVQGDSTPIHSCITKNKGTDAIQCSEGGNFSRSGCETDKRAWWTGEFLEGQPCPQSIDGQIKRIGCQYTNSAVKSWWYNEAEAKRFEENFDGVCGGTPDNPTTGKIIKP